MVSATVACLPAAVSLLLLEALFMQISGVSLALTWPCRLCLLRVLLCTSLCYKLSESTGVILLSLSFNKTLSFPLLHPCILTGCFHVGHKEIGTFLIRDSKSPQQENSTAQSPTVGVFFLYGVKYVYFL
jgi:hypothetical protein